MFESSRIELSKSALTRNIRFIRQQIGQDVIISSVVKGNAYGHGITAFVPLAEACGLRHFSVFDATEAYWVRQAQTRADTQIMIMGYADSDGLEWAIENDVSFWIFDMPRLDNAMARARKVGKPARVHLELETGMNRTGLDDTEIRRAAEVIVDNPEHFVVEGICTHYAGAESIANYKRIMDQKATFDQLCQQIANLGITIPLRHSAASAASLSYPATRMDLVRIGIVQYGFWPSKETEMEFLLRRPQQNQQHFSDPLRRVLRWSSRVMHVNLVPPGQFVGYGTSYVTTRRQKIATVPVGYSHGFRRSLSNLGRVLIRGKRANVIGLVNMSMMTVDVTSIPSVEVGDEVVIIGRQGNARITVGSFTDMANLVNYEMLVRLPSDIPRVVHK
jgi:alanine racemase